MKTFVLIALLLVPATVLAHEDRENHLDNGVIHVQTREFLLGELHQWPKANVDFSTHFGVRSSIWLREFLDNDPVLKYQDFVIRRTRDQSFTGARYLALQMALTPIPSRDCSHCFFDLVNDPFLQVEGYDTYWNGFYTLKFLPKNAEIEHGFRCELQPQRIQPGELDSCSVVVVYPYDTNIVLNGFRILPGLVTEYGQNFADIAQRMLEIATCIDITGKLIPEGPAEFPQLLQNHPNLKRCEIELTG
ncbi:hypothetical protein O2N63_00325 [Aliiroseovarius sp. KMU-50]|uniref:Uncharacterized protein n=1 Tax=Aliiroseovarius salicola TaxID=3009082 RepID=A0ABT4VWC1_9RHOB|nr:hypothetical protein [Aliiroseovarius sp. KMU-50]MDA5092534.1 hypothetical protein [Aliiroseovarius sp. KMU-50]